MIREYSSVHLCIVDGFMMISSIASCTHTSSGDILVAIMDNAFAITGASKCRPLNPSIPENVRPHLWHCITSQIFFSYTCALPILPHLWICILDTDISIFCAYCILFLRPHHHSLSKSLYTLPPHACISFFHFDWPHTDISFQVN